MSNKDYEPINLEQSNFYRHELQGYEVDNILNVFNGFVEAVNGRINDGKEATVYLCKPTAESWTSGLVKHKYLAAKMYKANKFRGFENDRSYRNFDKFKDKRLAKVMKKKSKKGQKAFRNHWIESEWDYLNLLHDAGVNCPKPYALYDDGILMSCFLEAEVAAPRLIDCMLTNAEAEVVLNDIINDVKLMAENNIVHGDLSAYNILFNGVQHCIIDIPQAVDIRITPDAYNLFQRDLQNLQKYFNRYDLEVPVAALLQEVF